MKTRILRTHAHDQLTDYDVQAKNFLAATNTRLELTLSGVVDGFPFDTADTLPHYDFIVKLRRLNTGKTYTTHFYDSYNNWKARKMPTEYDVLAGLITYDVGDFDEFCLEFGYCTDSITAYKTWKEVIKQYEKLSALYTPDELDMLSEIV